MEIFNGIAAAAQRESALIPQVAELQAQGRSLCIAAILFSEDTGSQLYTRLKKEAAERVGIEYRVFEYSLTAPPAEVTAQLQELAADPTVTGIIIQKPWRRIWQTATGHPADAYQAWWRALTSQLSLAKDVDGLHPDHLQAIEAGQFQPDRQVLPATCRAVLAILSAAGRTGETLAELPASPLATQLTIIIGRSDLLGRPLTGILRQAGWRIELLGTKGLAARHQSGQLLLDAKVVISATGQPAVVTGEMVAPEVILVDAGEPKPDIDQASLDHKPAFLTLVPGGVGPLTVVCLLENALALAGMSPDVIQ